MVKAMTSGLDAHIHQEETTVCTLWRQTLRDGTQLFFTDHDLDLFIDVDLGAPLNEKTYIASEGYRRTTIRSTATLSVDNIDLKSFFGTLITEQDMRGQRFDWSEIEIYLVNWNNLSDSVTQLRRGFMGQVSIRDEVWTAELRGMVQVLAQNIGDLFQPGCRADHGDSLCTFDISQTTETSEVEVIDATNRLITVPATHIDTVKLGDAPDVLFSIGTKIDNIDLAGRVQMLKRATVPDGTPRNPYLVTTVADVNDMRDDVHAWYALTTDIDMTAHGLFTPIPNFRGGLDGRGFEISNLDLDHSLAPLGTPVGLFREIEEGAVIRRLGCVDFDVNAGESTEYKAPLVGVMNDATVEDCFADSVAAGGVETDGDQAGGLVGNLSGTGTPVLRRCWCAVPFTGAIGALVGGLVGNQSGGVIANGRFDLTVATTSATGTGIAEEETNPRTTAQMQDPADWPVPNVLTGTVVEQQVGLPSRLTAVAYDFFTMWIKPVLATSYPSLREWY